MIPILVLKTENKVHYIDYISLYFCVTVTWYIESLFNSLPIKVKSNLNCKTFFEELICSFTNEHPNIYYTQFQWSFFAIKGYFS